MGRCLVLLGDSIFDNGAYVPNERPVVEQVQQQLHKDDRAVLLAVDGHVTEDVSGQLSGLPDDASHLFVSVGGNDALMRSHILESARSHVIAEMTEIHDWFGNQYQRMLDTVCAVNLPTTVCTIYDAVPGLPAAAVMALSVFNDVIIRTACARGIPLIDLRFVCREAHDYSRFSPIEPSAIGGAKIADRIVRVMRDHDFTWSNSTVYT